MRRESYVWIIAQSLVHRPSSTRAISSRMRSIMLGAEAMCGTLFFPGMIDTFLERLFLHFHSINRFDFHQGITYTSFPKLSSRSRATTMSSRILSFILNGGLLNQKKPMAYLCSLRTVWMKRSEKRRFCVDSWFSWIDCHWNERGLYRFPAWIFSRKNRRLMDTTSTAHTDTIA